MRTRSVILALTVLITFTIGNALGQSNWNQFRGPNGSGITAETKKLPVEFSGTNNLIWKTELNKGNSSPCIWGDNIFLTAYNDKMLETVCINRKNGKINWRQTLAVERFPRMHPINNPVTDLI